MLHYGFISTSCISNARGFRRWSLEPGISNHKNCDIGIYADFCKSTKFDTRENK